MQSYKTKTQKKNALAAIETKARKLYLSGVMSVSDVTKIMDMTKRSLRKL